MRWLFVKQWNRLVKGIFIIYLISVIAVGYAEPWGKDSDLVHQDSKDSPLKSYGLGIAISEVLIKFHQDVISEADGPRSHFKPSSSQYTLDAIRKYGFFRGYLLGCDRIMRENNEKWVYRTISADYGWVTKFDPVR